MKRLGVETMDDLLHYYPRRYEDRSQLKSIFEVRDGEVETIAGRVLGSWEFKSRRGLVITKVAIGDETGIISGLWFNQPYMKNRFKIGDRVIFSGRVDRSRDVQILNPEYEVIPEEGEVLIHTGRIVPIYPLTENLSQRTLRFLIKGLVDNYASHLPEILPEAIRSRNRLMEYSRAITNIHFPESFQLKEEARRRLVFDEFFFLELGLALRRREFEEKAVGIPYSAREDILEKLERILPFRLTPSQRNVIEEIRRDMQKSIPMNRLVQGDVGSGKTVLALAALLIAIEDGYQGALMAPTEILAEQHYFTLQEVLLPLSLKVALLIGSMTKKMKEEALKEIKSGEAQIIVGTHALIQEEVQFHKLGLVVIDEQHKFGVLQRASLRDKGLNPDILIMTATPIPRTLALTVYGDLDVSVVRGQLPGRKPVVTYWLPESKRNGVYNFIREQVKAGRQAYIVYPLVEESEELELKSVTTMAELLQRSAFPDLKVGLLHGRLKGEEKERIMRDFKARKIDILVSTTVIEVGIDVPNASVMLIEDADRFGLAQLHQLRGRVGRGGFQSYCLLLASPKSEEGRRRLKAMVETSDGFEIAAEDLALRGPGEFFGTRQHGLPDLKIANIVQDMESLELARREAFELVKLDPDLKEPEHWLIREHLLTKFKGKLKLVTVG